MISPTRGSATKSNVPKFGFSPCMGDIKVTVARVSIGGLVSESIESMTAESKGRKPRDPNQLAKFIVNVASGRIEDRDPYGRGSGERPFCCQARAHLHVPESGHAAARIGREKGVATLAQMKQNCASLEDRDVSVDQPRPLAEGLVCECSALLNGTLSTRQGR